MHRKRCPFRRANRPGVGPDILDTGCLGGRGPRPASPGQAESGHERRPSVEVVGLDPDPKALARSRRKAKRAGAAIRFDQGSADALPYADATFDRVFSSLMFHHLPHDAKLATMREVRRVLKPGGALHLLDFEQEGSHSHNPLARWLHASKRLQDNNREQILAWMGEAGFIEPRVVDFDQPIFGKIAYLAARSGV